jgi:hypothetical protein
MIGVLVVAALTFSIGFAQGNGGIFACVDEEGNFRKSVQLAVDGKVMNKDPTSAGPLLWPGP